MNKKHCQKCGRDCDRRIWKCVVKRGREKKCTKILRVRRGENVKINNTGNIKKNKNYEKNTNKMRGYCQREGAGRGGSRRRSSRRRAWSDGSWWGRAAVGEGVMGTGGGEEGREKKGKEETGTPMGPRKKGGGKLERKCNGSKGKGGNKKNNKQSARNMDKKLDWKNL